VISLTLANLLGPYAAEPWTPAELASGANTVRTWNALAAAAESDGIVHHVNPATGCHIGGTGNGGARPKGSKVGAPGSRHQLLLALDWFDPYRAFMRWLLSYGLERATSLGMSFEHPQFTKTWTHGQIVPPGDGLTRWQIFFVPYADLAANPPTCEPLPEQRIAMVPEFAFRKAA
jgi:hypothetical protein